VLTDGYNKDHAVYKIYTLIIGIMLLSFSAYNLDHYIQSIMN